METYLKENASASTRSASDPARGGSVVTPSNSTVIAGTKALYVGTGGDVAVNFLDSGTSIVLKNVAQGSILPVRVTKVLSTGTTASNIVALY